METSENVHYPTGDMLVTIKKASYSYTGNHSYWWLLLDELDKIADSRLCNKEIAELK